MHRTFLENGYHIFSLYGVTDGKCDCGNEDCQALYKHPRISNWPASPLWSDDQLDLMEETDQFATGYGVLCKNLIVLDVDQRNGGIPSFELLSKLIPEIAGAGLIVNTGSGGGSRHLYFKAPQDVALERHLKEYKGLDFQSGNSFVVGPNSMHKSGNTYTVAVGTPDDIDDAPQALIDLLTKPERHRVEYSGAIMDVSNHDVANMVSYCDPDSGYDDWVRIGMAIHHVLNGDGFAIWDEWSQRSAKYDDKSMETKWHSFGRSAMPVTVGTLIHFAEQGGWKQPVEFTSDTLAIVEDTTDPLDTSGVDLQRPIGFVGEVVEWFNGQCRYPRENLTVAAAIVAVGNVAGLRYTDDLDGINTNMFAFCVAASGTGKEAVMQAVGDVHRVAGVSGATVGGIKSEQEITKNLIRHQAAFYVIDEIGITLRKIKNAATKGTAAYLEGVIGMLMSAYSKANSFLLLNGDVKDDMRKILIQDAARYNKAIENNEDKSGLAHSRLKGIERQLSTLDQGLEKPFVSIIGFTTPETFDDLMDFEQATAGFVGRSILFSERESNPRPKLGFKKKPMSDKMKRQLSALYHGGNFDQFADRVEHYGKRVEIKTTPEAADALAKALVWVIEYAEQQKATTGLEAVVRRGYELMAKVSLILAVQEGIRTVEHVRWAFALMQRDIEDKMKLVVSNDVTHGQDLQLMAKITKIISKDHGEKLGVIKNRLRKYKASDVETALLKMEQGGAAKKVEVLHKRNGTSIVTWFAC